MPNLLDDMHVITKNLSEYIGYTASFYIPIYKSAHCYIY